MKRWQRAGREALLSGAMASAASALALVAAARSEGKPAAAPVNAISHWIWGDKALRRNAPSARFTASGYAVHHASACFWAVFYERFRSRSGRPGRTLRDAALMSGLACLVDLRLTPHRFTPGFEHRLRPASLFATYAAFALGLAGCSLARDVRRERHAMAGRDWDDVRPGTSTTLRHSSSLRAKRR